VTKQHIHETIAEAIGWTKKETDCGTLWTKHDSDYFTADELPNFTQDKAAMHEAEQWLCRIDAESYDDYFCNVIANHKSFASATPAARAQEFLKILGKYGNPSSL
jgi:hypothetical protein